MANKRILQYPSSQLRKKSLPVDFETDDVEGIVRDLIDTLEVHNGAGLASPQIGCHKRVLLLHPAAFDEENPDPLPGREKYMAMVNPEMTLSKETVRWPEACLSVPLGQGSVERSKTCDVKYWTWDGEEKNMTLEWPLSSALQHEYDHLDGKLYIDRLSSFSRNSIIKKIKKHAKSEERKRELKKQEEILDLYGEAALRKYRAEKKKGGTKKKRPVKKKNKKSYGKNKRKKK